MKKLLTIMLSVLMVCGLAACSKKAEETPAETTAPVETAATETEAPVETEETTELANPWVDCNDAQEAAQVAGFEFELPESETVAISYRAVEGQIFEATYGEADGTVVRKALGFDGETLAGDYNEYENGGTIYAGEDKIEVTYKGSEAEVVNVAYWTIGDYTYSLTSTTGISADSVTEFAAAAK